jgi:hypothetical protein
VRRVAWAVAAAFVAVSCAGNPSSDDSASPLTTVVDCEPVPDAVCRGAALAGADLSGRSLVGIDLRNADLSGANLSDADLTQAVLIGANLAGANLDGALLARATLDGAVLSTASVRGTIFSNASLRNVDFDGVETALAVATNAVTDGAKPADVVNGLLDDDVESASNAADPPLSAASARDVAPIFEELAFRVSRDRIPPTKAARKYTYVSLAMLTAAAPDDPLLSGVIDFADRPARNPGADPIVSAIVAGSIVARRLFTVPADRVTLAEVADSLVSKLGADLSGEQLRESFHYGAQIARFVMGRTERDGYVEAQNFTAREAMEPGDWVPTSPNFQSGIDPGWGTLVPFFATTRNCSLPALRRGDDANSPYQELADEVATVAANLTEEQRAIARFWDDGRGRTGTPAGHWMVLATRLSVEREMTATDMMRMLAHSLMAGSDAFIAVWREKYLWMVERPITILQRADVSWSSYLVTPAFPEYPSGHSGVSRAIADVLTGYLGTVSFVDPGYGLTEQSRRQFNVTPRSFDSLRDAADEVSLSRLYGGIHFMASLDAGQALGACIAQSIPAPKP